MEATFFFEALDCDLFGSPLSFRRSVSYQLSIILHLWTPGDGHIDLPLQSTIFGSGSCWRLSDIAVSLICVHFDGSIDRLGFFRTRIFPTSEEYIFAADLLIRGDVAYNDLWSGRRRWRCLALPSL